MQNYKFTQYGHHFLKIIVSTRLRNDLHVFIINYSDIIFHPSSTANILDGKLHLLYFLKRPHIAKSKGVKALACLITDLTLFSCFLRVFPYWSCGVFLKFKSLLFVFSSILNSPLSLKPFFSVKKISLLNIWMAK